MFTDWAEEYKRKIVTPEEAIAVIKPGDRVPLAYSLEPLASG